MRLFRSILPLLAVAFLWPGNLLVTDAAQQRKLGGLTLEPYEYKIEGHSIEGELGRLVVKENRRDPNSNLIELAFVRLTARPAGRRPFASEPHAAISPVFACSFVTIRCDG